MSVAGSTAGLPVVAEIVRSGFVEGHHYGSIVALGGDGSVEWSVGEVVAPVLPRSSNKPVQALAMVELGLDLPPDLLALACASHSGEAFHVDGVRRTLASAGLDESALQTPPDYPLDDETREAVIRDGGARSPILMNCSGKHAAMLATCVLRGWDTESYLEPEHPLQLALTGALADLAGADVVATAVDGCGAPLLGISLTALARSFGTLVESTAGTPERTVADAMRGHPELVSGTDTVEQKLMAAVPGMLVKAGAEGVMAVAVPGAGAVAVKMDDGAHRGNRPVLVSALRRIGVTGAALEQAAAVPVLGGGEPVGELHSTW